MFTVNPWTVEGEVDYSKLVEEFGTKELDEKLIKRLEDLAKDSNVMLRRKYFYSHRDLDKIIKEYEQGKGFFLYTGRGPSGKMHLGHIIPFYFTKWMQQRFNVNLYIQITDDEKYWFKDRSIEQIDQQAEEDMLHIAAIGFKDEKTFIFRDSEYIKNIYKLLMRVAKKINYSTIKAVFGLKESSNIGQIFYPALQIIPTFFEKRRALIPSAIDQDPYWRIQRDVAEKLGYEKTAAIHSKFLPPLDGLKGKMSSSKGNAIYLDDDEGTIEEKIKKYAFSGGRSTLKEHRELGGIPEIDVCFNWLAIFLEEDDNKIKKIYDEYKSGRMTTGELKAITIEKIITLLNNHKKALKDSEKRLRKIRYDGELAKQMWSRNYE